MSEEMINQDSMYTTKVKVTDLVIDMPLDGANVEEKVKSLQVGGLVQPVIVWLEGMRIIDGFHRVEAARCLGWTEIDCIVKDCSKEVFWYARIQSAKQHHRISQRRLLAWMHESWASSEWADRHIAKEAWNVLRKKIHKVESEGVDFYNRTWAGDPISDWVVSKAETWGVRPSTVIKIILQRDFSMYSEPHDKIAARRNLNWEQRQALSKIVPPPNYRESGETEAYLDHIGFPEKFTDFNPDTLKQKRADFGAFVAQWKTKQENTPEGQRYMQDQLRVRIKQDISKLTLNVEQNEDVLRSMPDAHRTLKKLAQWAQGTMQKLWPNKSPLTETQLQKELAAAKRRILELERAQGIKDRYQTRLPDVMARSSTELR